MDWSNEFHRCHDCQAVPGTYHSDGCDTQRCPLCKGQRMCCDCPVPDDERLPWTGIWPGSLEAAELGLWTRMGGYGEGWIPCAADHPDAGAGLNEWAERGCPDTPVALRLIVKAREIARDAGMKDGDRKTILKGVLAEILRELRL